MRRALIERKLAKVGGALDRAIAGAEIPGAVVLARHARDGEVLRFEAVRGHAVTRPERVPMRRDTIFDLASLTKVLATTSAVMLLAERGALALDDPVARFLPAFAERGKEAVTLRHLLTHSSGLRPWRAYFEVMLERERKKGERWLGTARAKDWVLDSICRSALVHELGTAAVYGDLDFIVLGAVVEALAGETLDAFCRANIFEPLGLRDTFFIPLGADAGANAELPAARRRRIAATENCSWRERILWGEVHDPNASALGGVAGHAGLFGTADDLMRFAEALLEIWHGADGVFRSARLREFATRQNLPDGASWALGWDTPSETGSTAGQHFSRASIGHLGFTGVSLWVDFDARSAVVLLTNRAHLLAKKSRFALRPVVHDFIREAFDA